MDTVRMLVVGVLILIAFLLLVLSLRLFMLGKQSQSMQPVLGVSEGKLKACPKTPNCVCSFPPATKALAEPLDDNVEPVVRALENRHAIAPIGGGQTAFNILAGYLSEQKNVRIMDQSERYLHATFQSAIFGFVDDVELLVVGDKVHLRSASRVGYSDLGQNRKRVEGLRLLLEKQL